MVRYLVVDLGIWTNPRKVLISPAALKAPDFKNREVSVLLSREQVKTSPDIDTEKPVERQHEIDLFSHYGWNPYWFGDALLSGPYPGMRMNIPVSQIEPSLPPVDLHLHSARSLKGFSIDASNIIGGHLVDFIADLETWKIRYLVIDNGKWFPGRKTVVATQWVKGIDEVDMNIDLDITQTQLHNAPQFSTCDDLTRDYEASLYGHYERPNYWTT
jgi:hypothetical protein